MPDGAETLTIRTVDAIASVDAAAWDRCAGGDNPFVAHAFLRLLEETGCVGRESGWLPQHCLLEDAAGNLLAAAPALSQGPFLRRIRVRSRLGRRL